MDKVARMFKAISPSTNEPNRASEPSPVCGESPGGQAADAAEKQT